MSRELKAYELRPAPRPLYALRYRSIVSTVQVRRDWSLYYCYVAFSDKLVENVGKKMPQGVGRHNPALLHVEMGPEKYFVYARYFKDGFTMFLWEGSTEALPAWLQRLHLVRKV